MLLNLEMKIILGLALCGASYYASTLPERYREEGREQERSAYRKTSDAALIKRDFEFLDVKTKLEAERANRENDRIEHDKKFAQYVADARAGRIHGFSGLRVSRSGLCAPRTEETTGTSGNENQETARLPRALEEGLFGFANDRDEIIADFEAFKQEVRLAGCFATESKP